MASAFPLHDESLHLPPAETGNTRLWYRPLCLFMLPSLHQSLHAVLFYRWRYREQDGCVGRRDFDDF